MKLIPLKNRRGDVVEFTKVDDSFFKELNEFNWCLCISRKKKYAKRYKRTGGKFICIPMQNQILNIPVGTIGDHKDGDGLNNQTYNLRKASSLQNAGNRQIRAIGKSKYVGVSWIERIKKWQASISFLNKKVYLGVYKTEKEAAVAYNEAAIKFRGEFVNLNKI